MGALPDMRTHIEHFAPRAAAALGVLAVLAGSVLTGGMVPAVSSQTFAPAAAGDP